MSEEQFVLRLFGGLVVFFLAFFLILVVSGGSGC